MTFPISNSEKVVMTLSFEKADKPESASSFGKIMVDMDGENCKLFLKHYETLKGKPRIEKIIGRAKSFVEEKNGKQNEPFSVLEEVSAFKCTNCVHHLS